MEIFLLPETWMAVLTLTLLEIVLGIDNIIFVSIVSNKLPPKERARARNIGLSMALIFRILLLAGITWVIGFTKPLFTVWGFDVAIRDIILAGGGLFLIAKSTSEISQKMEGFHDQEEGGSAAKSVALVIIQIILLDIIFSFDSILTAVGLTRELPIMVVAVVIAVFIMMVFSGRIAAFIAGHPSLEVLALSFLILIGFMLAIEAAHQHVPKGYIYFAVFFSILVEMINMRVRRHRKNPVKLNRKVELVNPLIETSPVA